MRYKFLVVRLVKVRKFENIVLFIVYWLRGGERDILIEYGMEGFLECGWII